MSVGGFCLHKRFNYITIIKDLKSNVVIILITIYQIAFILSMYSPQPFAPLFLNAFIKPR